jgi:hypothetical protein
LLERQVLLVSEHETIRERISDGTEPEPLEGADQVRVETMRSAHFDPS